MLESNRDLSRRISILEQARADGIGSTAGNGSALLDNDAFDNGAIPTAQRVSDHSLLRNTIRSSIGDINFEKILGRSRAYRKATRDTVDYSFRSSVARSHAWSNLSDISLSEISAIAVIALPISPKSIANGYHYEQAGYIRRPLPLPSTTANNASFDDPPREYKVVVLESGKSGASALAIRVSPNM